MKKIIILIILFSCLFANEKMQKKECGQIRLSSEETTTLTLADTALTVTNLFVTFWGR